MDTIKETQRHIDAYNQYFLLRNDGMSVTDAVKIVAREYDVRDTSVWRWHKAFDWKGKEAIQTHDIQAQVYEKTNAALSDNKAWYLKNLHKAIEKAESQGSITIENMLDYERATKLALTIQGDDNHDNGEVKDILRGLLEVAREAAGGLESVGAKSRFDSKD